MPGNDVGDGLVIEPYAESDSEACLRMERRSAQGLRFQLGFRRPTFHRRAENFDDHVLLVARLRDRLVGVTAAAFKNVTLHGRPHRAAFHFDLRVDPACRNQAIATRLVAASYDVAGPRCDLGYCYAMDDNRAMQAMTALFGGWDVGGYRYFVWPTYQARAPRAPVRSASLSDVHERLLATAPPFDLYTDPRSGGSTAGHVASWTCETPAGRAGLSAWDNRDILAEVVERLPWPLRVLRTVLERAPFASHPHIPATGEQLRSWYLFDVHASSPSLLIDVLREASARARESHVDFLYIPWVPGDEPWLAAVRREIPRLFTTEIGYRLLLGPPWPERCAIRRPYVDVRDL